MKRLRVPQIPLFDERAQLGLPHWPTLRGARLEEQHFKALSHLADLVCLIGDYQTNLNVWNEKSSLVEKALFGETRDKIKTRTGESYVIYILWWIGNYHAGSIFHMAYQYPHYYAFDEDLLLKRALRHFRRVCEVAYSGRTLDDDVAEFLEKFNKGGHLK